MIIIVNFNSEYKCFSRIVGTTPKRPNCTFPSIELNSVVPNLFMANTHYVKIKSVFKSF